MNAEISPKERAFVRYWEANRQRQKKLLYQLAVGLPMGLLLGAVIFYNLKVGWYTRAEMVANAKLNPVVLYVALGIIAVFIAIFSKRFQWEQREQHYREILAKIDGHAAKTDDNSSDTIIIQNDKTDTA